MPRKRRHIVGNTIYHVLNRATGRTTIFRKPEDYAAFERTLLQAHARYPLRILAYVLMPNHFHLVLWPRRGQGELLSTFMRWLQVTHTQRRHAHYHTAGTGHLYQGRFKSFPVQGDRHIQTVCRYVERNPLRANLCNRAEQWPWSSLHRRIRNSPEDVALLSPWPEGATCSPERWLTLVNTPLSLDDQAALQRSIQRGTPLGAADWMAATAKAQDLEHTLRPRGRPRKQPAVKKDS